MFFKLVNWLIIGAVLYAIYMTAQDEAIQNHLKEAGGTKETPLVPENAHIPFWNSPEAEKAVDAPAKDPLKKAPDTNTSPPSPAEKPPAKE